MAYLNNKSKATLTFQALVFGSVVDSGKLGVFG
jgi:hypothetical protein